MIKYILTVLVALSLISCSTFNQKGGFVYRLGQERKLADAVALLEQGKKAAADKLLTDICSETGVPGVTDEALFRLSILRLESIQDRNSLAEAQKRLERLGKEFPTSSWAPLASSLVDFIESADTVRLEDKKLRESNLSLTKENRELRQSIEKLKSLEIEMGKGPKH